MEDDDIKNDLDIEYELDGIADGIDNIFSKKEYSFTEFTILPKSSEFINNSNVMGITKCTNNRYIKYCVNVCYKNNLCHVIELVFWKNNYVNDYIMINEVKDYKLVKIIDCEKNIHLTINFKYLLRTSLRSFKDRIKKCNSDDNGTKNIHHQKAKKDYYRIKKLSDTITIEYKETFMKQIIGWMRDEQIMEYNAKIKKFPYVLFENYPHPTEKKINCVYKRMLNVITENDIVRKSDLVYYYIFDNNADINLFKDFFKIFYKENIQEYIAKLKSKFKNF